MNLIENYIINKFSNIRNSQKVDSNTKSVANKSKNDAKNSIPLIPILLTNFIGTLGFSIVLPFLVFLVIDFGGNIVVYGILVAMYPVFQLIGGPILGKWSDIYGRKKILLISQGGTLMAWIIFLFALFLPVDTLFRVNYPFIGTFVITLPLLVLFFARALDGITGGNTSVANAYLADISSDENRGKNFGKMAISSNLGLIIGPAFAGILGTTLYQEILPVLAALLISLITLIVIKFTLKESRLSTLQISEKECFSNVFSQDLESYPDLETKKRRFYDIIKLKHISFLLLFYFFIFLGFNIFYTSFPIHAIESLGWTVKELGLFLAVLSGIMILIQGPVLHKALKKISEEKLVIIGNLILGSNFILFIFNDNFLIYLATVLFASGNGLMWPSANSIIAKHAGKAYQGSVQGIASSFGSLASIIGLISGGILYNLLGEITFLIDAGVIFLVFIMSFRLLKIKIN